MYGSNDLRVCQSLVLIADRGNGILLPYYLLRQFLFFQKKTYWSNSIEFVLEHCSLICSLEMFWKSFLVIVFEINNTQR